MTVNADDVTVGDTTPDAFSTFNLAITDVNEAPSVTVTPVLSEIAEDADLAASTKVADILVTDDALGTNDLALTGDDAALFEIVENGDALELHLVAGATLDAASNATLDVNVEVDDADVVGTPDATAPFAITVTPGDVGTQDQVVLRINAFGPEVAANDGGPVWQADLKDVAGTPQNENSPYLVLVSTSPTQDRGDTFAGYTGNPALIPAVVPDEVLDSARSSDEPFSYIIPVEDLAGNGTYRVNMYFAELFGSNQPAGNRIFDIDIEGTTEGVLDNFDPSAPNGGGDLTFISYEVDVQDGFLNIGFAQDAVNGTDNPIVNAIEVIKVGVTPTIDTDGPAASIELTNPETADAALLVEVTLTDATGVDEATLGANDLLVTGDAGAVSFDGITNGVATYSIAAPTDGWQDDAAVVVTLQAGEVADTLGNTNLAVSAPITLQIDDGTAPTDVLLRINSFGPEITAADGPNWLADTTATPSPFFTGTQNRGDTDGPLPRQILTEYRTGSSPRRVRMTDLVLLCDPDRSSAGHLGRGYWSR